jgi:hypothetical protein
MQIASVTLGGKSCYEPAQAERVNYFVMGTGASRAGAGEVLMLRKDYQDLVASNDTGVARLRMQDGTTGQAGVDFDAVILGATPHLTRVGSSRDLDMVRVAITDARYIHKNTTKAYNVQRQGFPQSSTATEKFYTETLNSSSEWTWAEVMSNLELQALPVAITSWKPRNLIFDGVPLSLVADEICSRLWVVAGFNPSTGVVDFHTPGQMNAANAALLAKAEAYRVGGQSDLRNNKRLPGLFSVIFKVYNADDPSEPFASRTSTVPVSTGTGRSAHTQPLHVGDYIAYRTGGSISNSAELSTVANNLAARAIAFMSVPCGVHEFAGLWPFRPDGAIREVEWVSEPPREGGAWGGARTRITLDNRRDWDATRLPGFNETYCNQLIAGLGATNVSMAGAGARLVWGGSQERFIARIDGSTQDGSNFRWEYDFVEVKKATAGYGGWTDKTNGRTGTAYNLIEDQNGASGLFGNGVDSSNLSGTSMEVQPVPDGTRVEIFMVTCQANGETEYWFSYENGIDGECE